jgi:HEPN domain-containing protein
MLVWRSIAFPKWHDITALLKRLPVLDRPDLTQDECERLTAYATTLRYPGDYPPITLVEARQAAKTARRVRKQIRARLPRAAPAVR